MPGLVQPFAGAWPRSALHWLFRRTDLPGMDELKALPPVRRAVLSGLLLLICAALVLPVVAMVSLEVSLAGQTMAGFGGGGVPERADGMPLGQFVNITQRPLFSRTRQPLDAAAQPMPVEAPAAGPARLDLSLVLRGVFMDGVQTKAFLTAPDNPVGTWVALNEEISGWRLAEVRPGEIVVEARGERQTLPLSILAK
jgi:hypothetical protein